jgi:hypothetical protein
MQCASLDGNDGFAAINVDPHVIHRGNRKKGLLNGGAATVTLHAANVQFHFNGAVVAFISLMLLTPRRVRFPERLR